MQRDNSFDSNLTDIALRDVDYLRTRARQSRGLDISRAGIGACMDGACDAAGSRPVCNSTNINDLDRDFQQTTVVTRALAGQGVVTVQFNPIDPYFCPVAIAGIARDTVDGQTSRPFRLIQASIRGCVQYEWQNAADTIAGAVGWVDSSELDPTFRGGCACRVNYGCFTNTFGSQAVLNIVLGNPAPAGVTIDIKLTLWGVAYSCCPKFTNVRDFQKADGGPMPTGAVQPLGNARRSAFAG